MNRRFNLALAIIIHAIIFIGLKIDKEIVTHLLTEPTVVNNQLEVSQVNIENFDFSGDYRLQVPEQAGSLQASIIKSAISSGDYEEEVEENPTQDVLLNSMSENKTSIDWKNGQEALISELEVGSCFVDFSPNLPANNFGEKILKVPCTSPHNYEVIFIQNFLDINQDSMLLELEARKRCNEVRSLYQIVEFVDENYLEYFFYVQPLFDEPAIRASIQNQIFCLAYFEHIDSPSTDLSNGVYLKENNEISFTEKAFIDLSFVDGVNRLVYNTSWADEIDAGLVCASWMYAEHPFSSEFLLFYSQPFNEIKEMIFTYSNSTINIEIDFLQILSNFTDSGRWTEQIFYYFLPLSQVSVHGILNNDELSSNDIDLIFEEKPENVFGEFYIKFSNNDTRTSSCTMADS
tara:strand:- start:145 stop:1356 length:1212 start_codon:yes stop_codon:yes gene_type:complete